MATQTPPKKTIPKTEQAAPTPKTEQAPPAAEVIAVPPETAHEAIAALEAENAALKEQLAQASQLASAGGLRKAELELVQLKVTAGLSPEQAREVVINQKRHDAILAKG